MVCVCCYPKSPTLPFPDCFDGRRCVGVQMMLSFLQTIDHRR